VPTHNSTRLQRGGGGEQPYTCGSRMRDLSVPRTEHTPDNAAPLKPVIEFRVDLRIHSRNSRSHA
jgi:hypothetical protein